MQGRYMEPEWKTLNGTISISLTELEKARFAIRFPITELWMAPRISAPLLRGDRLPLHQGRDLLREHPLTVAAYVENPSAK
jgi:hypothetical protein